MILELWVCLWCVVSVFGLVWCGCGVLFVLYVFVKFLCLREGRRVSANPR